MYCKRISPRILVVIDMQKDGFPLAVVVIHQVLREMALAMEEGAMIVIVSFDLECAGPTDARIMSLLESSGYDHWMPVKKKAEDGSAEIVAALQLSSADSPPVFRVVGVTTDDCITKTVHGLVRLLPDCVVEVVTDACTNWQGPRYDWSAFSSSPNVKLITPGSQEPVGAE